MATTTKNTPGCSYCSADARGIDEDGESTCGDPSCTPIVRDLPAVTELSGDDYDDREEV